MTSGELNLKKGVAGPDDLVNVVASAAFTIGADAGTTITVNIQLKDWNGQDLAFAAAIPFYLSSDAAGQVIASATSGGIAAGTDGTIIEWTANLSGMMISEADGDIDVVLTEAGAGTWYLNLVLPGGKIVTSGAITFSA